MAQVNQYATKAAYAADNDRLKTKSAVSYITENNEVIFDGVNVVVDKPSAAEGDLAVWDSVENRVRFIKAATILKVQIPTTLTPFAVVLGWRGDKVFLAAIKGAMMSDWNIAQASSTTAIRWAHGFELRISGILPNAAGGLIVTLQSGTSIETATATWEGGNLASIAAAIQAAIKEQPTTQANKNWSATADGDDIILTRNYSTTSVVTNIEGSGSADNAKITATDEVDLQMTYAYLTGTESIRRRNGSNSWFAGGNYAKFYDYYRNNGAATTGIGLHSATILKESSFTEEENPIVFAAYGGDYKAYLFGEHFAQYPSVYGVMSRDGKTTTAWLAAQLGTAVRGAKEPRYPAAWLAAHYDVDIDGFRAGAWWLPSTDEVVQMMQNRRLNAADTTPDPVNDTLVKMGATTIYGTYTNWTCCEYSSNYGFIFSGLIGGVYYYSKYYSVAVRPVSAF